MSAFTLMKQPGLQSEVFQLFISVLWHRCVFVTMAIQFNALSLSLSLSHEWKSHSVCLITIIWASCFIKKVVQIRKLTLSQSRQWVALSLYLHAVFLSKPFTHSTNLKDIIMRVNIHYDEWYERLIKCQWCVAPWEGSKASQKPLFLPSFDL